MTREQMTAAGTPQAQSGMTREEIVAFFERRQRLFDDLDAEGLAEEYADHAVVESPSAGTHTGRKAIEQAFRSVFGAFLDLKTHPEALLIDGDGVAQLVSSEGTQIGEFLGMPPTGKPFRLAVVFIYEFKDRKIVHERRIYDFTGLLIQIGMLKAKPV